MSLDCFRLLADLSKAGISNAEVSRLLDIDIHKIRRWKEGQEPKWSEGKALLALHTEHCSKKAESDVP